MAGGHDPHPLRFQLHCFGPVDYLYYFHYTIVHLVALAVLVDCLVLDVVVVRLVLGLDVVRLDLDLDVVVRLDLVVPLDALDDQPLLQARPQGVGAHESHCTQRDLEEVQVRQSHNTGCHPDGRLRERIHHRRRDHQGHPG